MAELSRYYSQIPSSTGQSGGVITPLALGENPLGALQAEKVGASFAEIFNRQRIENEKAQSTIITTDYDKIVTAERMKALSTTGESAITVGKNRGLVADYTEILDKKKEETLSGFTGSETIKKGLSDALDAINRGTMNQIAAHQVAENNKYRATAVDAVYETSVASIISGGSLESAVGNVNSAIDINLNGDSNKKLWYKARLELIFQKNEKDKIVTNNLLKLKSEFPIDYTADSATQVKQLNERIKKIESPEFIKSLGSEGAEISDKLLSATLREAKTVEDSYKKFAESKIGEISNKIYRNQKFDDNELNGLRPEDRALIEKINDYQIRQNRAELREVRTETRYERSEQRYAAQEAKIERQEKSDGIAGQILAKIIQGEPIDLTADIYSMIPKGLDTNKANQLAIMAGKLIDPAYKLGLNTIQKSVIDPVEYGKAVLDFKNQVDSENAKGERILKIAEEIAKPKKVNKIMQFFDDISAWKQTRNRQAIDSFYKVFPEAEMVPTGKIVGTSGGKNVYELPNGKWQVGE